MDDVQLEVVSASDAGDGPRAFGFEQIADCGSMRVVGLRLDAGQRVPEHRNAIPVALIVTSGRLRFDDGAHGGEVGVGEMLLINPGERHTYQADVATSAYLVFAGLPGVRSRTWTLRRRV
ncbi:MAG TPA: AraC family ligand binding domain-containing protein [Candidatus Dormibacteraeota bacterium]|nr:AraC family ligand binding domain-containing protein [Candidatus Dormibacteraeota bacterium]